MGKKEYLKLLLNILVWIFGILVLLSVVPRLLAFFMPFLVAFILSLMGLPMVRFLEQKIKIRRKYGTGIIIVFVIALLVLAVYGCILLLSIGLDSFFEYFPTLYENARDELNQAVASLESLLESLPFVQDVDFQSILQSLSDSAGSYLADVGVPSLSSFIAEMISHLPDTIVSVVVGLLATYYFIADHDKLKEIVKRHTSDGIQKGYMQIYKHILKAVGGYFKAQIKIMVAIYVIVFIGLIILRVKYAWLIAFGIAFLDMLPIFGTGTVLIPWAIVKMFSGSYTIAVGMLILYLVTLVVHQLIQPKLVGDTVGMDTFATIFFMYVGYKLSGILGMIIAIPVGMVLVFYYKEGGFDSIIWCIKTLVRDFNERRRMNIE